MTMLDKLLSRVSSSEERFEQRDLSRASAQESIAKGDLMGANGNEGIRERLSHLKVATDSSMRPGSRALESSSPMSPDSNPRAIIENVALERILGSNDLMPISFLDLGRQRARSVGRIHIKNKQGMAQGFGTGFLVSPHLLLTNNHVLPDASIATSSHVEFDFEVDLAGELRPTQVFPFDVRGFFLTDRDLDFTLVAIKPNEQFEPRQWGWIPLVQEDGLVVKGEYVSIIQHPNGEAKQLAMRENRVIDLLDHFAHYQTDTAPGSSGSPVFNDQWELVALHHSGVPERNEAGKIMAVNGQPWQRMMGEHRIKWIANEGVKGKRIGDFIKAAKELSSSQKGLREELFSIGPPSASSSAKPAESSSLTSGSLTSGDPGVVKTDGGVQLVATDASSDLAQVQHASGTTFTVPLNITISLGAGAAGSTVSGVAVPTAVVSSSAVASAPTVTTTPTVTTNAADADHVDRDDAALKQALSQLNGTRRRTYYDETKDKSDRESYYSDVDHQTLSRDEMFDVVSDLLRTTHTTTFRYRPSQHVYPWVDLHPDRKLRSVYSGKPFQPETLIREDFRIEQERKVMLQELLKFESELSEQELEQQIERLEKQNPFNCEHVVPQSWYAKKEPMKGDLHHLFTCESGCNSFRGNLGYFDFSDFDEATRTACGKRIDDRFEPSHGKGIVARATLYFLLRYPGHIDATDELPQERISMLLTWHGEHQVTEYELHRNQAIFEMQGNRNPLIDFPKWAAKIDFGKGITTDLSS